MSKRKTNLTHANWQFMHAREASRYNSSMTALRRANLDGVYDAHTNMLFYPQIMQPSHARWEQIPPPPHTTARRPMANGHANDSPHTNGTNHPTDSNDDMDVEELPPSPPTMFSQIPALISRNFAVIDTHFTAPPVTAFSYPGLNDPPGLSGIPDDVLDELPAECRRAFEQARRDELRWKQQWGSEAQSALRGDLRVGLNGYPV
ncbi:chromatin structure-remodeling complex subunit RSC7 [Teratosphaeriaceae sp. CCFEE 6253]|nr:chromatin structure-remodeling complex subunit RSC7 [Teratosphaeriaceae sp. CCFEE 6253]